MPRAKHTTPRDQQPAAQAAEPEAAPPSPEQRLSGLLADLAQLQTYLDERGAHTYDLAQRFIANARRDPSSRAYDERQATMLEYQHYIWREIAGRVGQLLSLYGDAPAPDATPPARESDPTTGG